jgi:type IV pilus assembly protein PilV
MRRRIRPNAPRTEDGVRRRGKQRSGLSLLEVVIALGMLGFGVLGAAAGQLASVRFNGESRLRTEAFYLAQQQMEAFHGMSVASLDAQIALGPDTPDPNNPLDPDPTDALPRSFSRSSTVTANTPEAGLHTLEVTVTWVDSLGRNRTVSIESVTASI